MNSGEFFRAAENLPLVNLEGLIPEGDAAILAPHPDDESLGCGGLIAALGAAGRQAQIVVMSDGAGSHPNSHSHPPPVLRALRRQEARQAATILGAREPIFLDWPDGAVPSSGPRFDLAVRALLEATRGYRTLLATSPLDPHTDHVATWHIAVAAAARGGKRLLAYPVWGWRYLYPRMAPIPPVEIPYRPSGWRLDIASRLSIKRRAVAAHRSQTSSLIADDPNGFVLSEDALSVLLRPFEVYLERHP